MISIKCEDIFVTVKESVTNMEGSHGSEGEGATPLMYACQQERPEDVRALLRSKPKCALERDRTLKTALHYCAENSSPICAELVLERAAELPGGHELLDAADEDGYTALHLVVIAGNSALLRFLISRRADVNKLDNERHSIVHWATVCGEVEALEIVLGAGANPSTPDIHGGYPVHYAAQMCGPSSEMGGDPRLGLAVLRLLLRHGVSVHVQDQDGRQPILWAASAGSADAILALVKAGANVEVDDKDGLTALHCAASRGHTECLETLVSLCGADIDVIDSNGCTALFYAVTLGHADATEFLLSNGSHPNRQDRKGRTPAHCGAAKGQMETVRKLGAHGADLWVRNVKGDYPLHEAVAAGRGSLVQWLLGARPEAINAPNNDGRCPLHVAAINNNVEMCKIILDHQGLVNPVMRTARGQLMTPLDAALHKGNRACAKYLQLHGGVPASKLTSHSAALRGPHRAESISDQMNTPDNLTVPALPRGAKSLSSSPVVLDTKSRTVQVRIREDVRHRRQSEYPSGDERRRRKRRVRHSRNSDNSSDLETKELEDTRRRRSKTKNRSRKGSRGKHKEGDEEDGRHSESSYSSSEESSGSDQDSQTGNQSRRKTSVSIERRTTESKTDQNNATKSANFEVKIKTDESSDARKSQPETGKTTGNQAPEVRKQTSRKSTKEETKVVKKEVVERTGDTEKSEKKETKTKTTKSEKTEKKETVNGEHQATDRPESEVAAAETGNAVPEITEGESSRVEPEDAASIEDAVTRQVVTAEVHQEHEENGQRAETKDSGEEKELVLQPEVQNSDVGNGEGTSQNNTTATEIVSKLEESKRETSETKREKRSTFEGTEYGTKNDENGEKFYENSTKEEVVEVFGQKVDIDTNYTKDERPRDESKPNVVSGEIEFGQVERTPADQTASNEQSDASERLGKDDVESERERAFSIVPDLQKRRESQSFRVLSDEDAESSQPVDSGFEPSPRRHKSTERGKSRIKRGKSTISQSQKKDKEKERDDEEEPNINVVSVTQAVQNSVRKYHLERRIFNELLELKRLQIRAGKSNEQVMVKRLVDEYKKAGLIVGLRQYDGAYSFKHFERYLYDQLRLLQSSDKKLIPRIKSSDNLDKLTAALRRTRAGKTILENIPDNPMLCTHCTHRCYHTTHAYTGIPCAAYIAKMNHHQMPKPTTVGRRNGFLPQIEGGKKQRSQEAGTDIAKYLRNVDPTRPVTLELSHGPERQVISLPTEKLDKNKRYYVTFTIKGGADSEKDENKHHHSSSM
ncbi:unnamed protein product [Bemisia tabaci]|uniref:Uncharacterized protein n=2 Tax=Bemisia tabaci TaxID=7038 RepID=A0A9P0F1I0_BEMTA|nr:unnamed protein product [Bemisia tabaci]